MDFDLPLLSDDDDKNSLLKNRMRKNYRHLRKWAKRTQTTCFRIYDRDIKEKPLAIDFYAGKFLIHLFADSEQNDSLLEEAIHALKTLFDVPEEGIHIRTRIKREKQEQYEKLGESQESFIVQEYGVKFKVNLVDYLDTGLFLDHRETRQLVAKEARGKRLLNLFSYTCAFSVHAAFQGAAFTKSVDMSNTYTAWGRENFLLNGLSLETNPIVRADCLRFLGEEREKYDVIIVDPPTLSRSKKMEQFLDLQRDYVELLEAVLELLSKGGVLFFSTNARKFSFDAEFNGFKVADISKKTLPLDFHSHKIHSCWKIEPH